MYLSHFHLRELPFELTADPRFLYLTPAHREALSNLEYGLSAAKAVTLLVGEAGTGKTTLLKAALEAESCRTVTCVYLHNPALTRGEFVEMLSHQLGLGAEAARSKTTLLLELEAALRRRRDSGEIVALVVDEAQSLANDLLEEIRLLANIETPAAKLLPVVLAGQPELARRLNLPELRQLKQRVALRCELPPLTVSQTAAYIAHRIAAAGGEAGRLFTREAVTLIHEYAAGIPRTVSVICDNALVTAFALGRTGVGRDVVLEVCRDFDLRPAAEAETHVAARPHHPAARAVVSGIPDLPREDSPAVVPGRRMSVLGL
jgi:general secretion pathway protein A